MTTYGKSVQWLRPYVESAKGLVNLGKLKKVRGFKVPVTKNVQTEGELTRHNHVNYEIAISLYHKVTANPKGRKPKYRHAQNTFWHVIDTLAHELAHLHEFDHQPAHAELQSKIAVKMFKLATKKGVTDTTKPWGKCVAKPKV